jgi:DNA-binding NarL/FixJ family response regulator
VTTVLLVDDEALVRAGLRMILESADDISVIGEAEDGHAAIEAVRQHRPDVVLMDIRMPRMDGLAATAAIRGDADPPSVVVLTTFDTDDYVFRALEAGATGFLLKDTPPTDLLRAVRLAASGDSMLSPTVTRHVISRFTAEDRSQRRREALARLEPLTGREREVLVEIGLGHANSDIARHLYMSEATVKTHISHLFDKLSATNRVQLAIVAFRAGLVD